MRTQLILTGLLLSLTLSPESATAAADPAALALAKRQLQAAVNGGKLDAILAARASFIGQAASGGSPALNYWIAYASWRAVPLAMSADRDEAKQLCKEGIAAADRAIVADARFADAIALKAGLQGLSFTFNPMSGMTLGPEMEEAYGRAEGMSPGNPRVALLKGIGTLHKPAFVGGGAKNARPQLQHAIELFAGSAPADSVAIDWGRDDAFLWAGRCAEQLDDLAGAKALYLEALGVNPNLGWVKAILLPAVEKKLAGGKAKS